METWIKVAEVRIHSYWVSAFCVNQLAGICGSNPDHNIDAVTGVEYHGAVADLTRDGTTQTQSWIRIGA